MLPTPVQGQPQHLKYQNRVKKDLVEASFLTSFAKVGFCRAMLTSSAAFAVMRCLCVCLSVCHVRELCQNE